MPAETESDASTGIYRCNDISALKFRVHVRTVEASDLDQDVENDKHEEELFSWQQRIFSPREISVYSDLNNCTSPLHKTYHKQITESDRNSNNSKNILFSYLLPDILHQRLERNILLHQNLVSTNKKNSKKNIETSRIPKPSNSVSNDDFNAHYLETCESRYELMYIMADVGYLIEGEANEHILVVMKWDSLLKVLSVFPDFNTTSGPGYLLEGFSDACNQYVFWIIPESSHFERKKDHKIAEQCGFSSADVQIPRQGLLNVHVFGEIKGARYFDLENIFVRYHMELPNGWSCQMAGDISGITQQAKILDGFANLNHLFEMTLTYNQSLVSPSDDSKAEHLQGFSETFPKLFFDVVGLDSWGRVGREGCSWIRVPALSGQHNFRLQCWRPMQNLSMSSNNMLKRYFIGGTPHLANMSFNGIPESFQGGRLSKFGVKEIATGELDVCLNIILHSQISTHLSEDFSQSSFLERFPALSLLQSVNVALKAFLWARKRIQSAISIE